MSEKLSKQIKSEDAGDITLSVSVPYRILRTLVWETLSSLYERRKEFGMDPKWWELEDIRGVVDGHFPNDEDINGLLRELEKK